MSDLSALARTEYGAQVVSRESNVYMHGFAKAIVAAWIAEFGTATPVRLVSRQWIGETCTGWELAA